jgi:5-methylthioadenosine/S-adenosylhomocysteine deaminase
MPRKSQYQVIRNALVLDINRQKVEYRDILLSGDSIIETGAHGMDAPPDAKIIDATDTLLIPGLVNAHTHGQGSLGKGLGDKWSLELLLNALPWAGSGLTMSDKYTAARLNAAEMILKGCTAAYDMFFEFPAPSSEGLGLVAKAYREVGVRVQLAPMMADTTFYRAIPGLLDSLPNEYRGQIAAMSATSHTEHLKICSSLLDAWDHDREWARPALGPTIPLHCSDEFLIGCRDLARDTGAGIQMHLAESKVQAVAGLQRYGKSLAAHLDKLELLDPQFTGAHCVWLDDDDLRRMSDSGARIAHNPASNLRLGSGIAPASRIRDRGITFGLGTDGSASSDNQNMFEAMRAAAFVSRIHSPDPSDWLGTWDVLKAATIGGAELMGMEDLIGQIEPGYRADLVFLDLANVNFVPLNNAANQIVNCEDSSAVMNVMVNGKMILENRRFVDFDYDGLRQDVALTIERLTGANSEKKEQMEALAPYVSAHCVGLACKHHHVSRTIYHTQISRAGD